jgi:SpoIID/LytB domain protein
MSCQKINKNKKNSILRVSIQIIILLILCQKIFLFSQNLVLEETKDNNLAFNAWLNGNFDSAKKQYEKILKNSDDNDIDKKIKIIKDLITIEKQLGNYQNAIKLCKNFLEQYETKNKNEIKKIFLEYGTLNYYFGDIDIAEKYLQKALEIDKDLFEANFNLGRVLLDKQDYQNAIEAFKKNIKLNPEFSGSYFYLGRIFSDMINFNISNEGDDNSILAKKNYNLALLKDGYFLEARLELVKLYLQDENYEKTFQESVKIQNIFPEFQGISFIIAKITPFLQEKNISQKIVPEKKLNSFKSFTSIKDPENLPILRIGINTNSSGMPIQIKNFNFRSSGEFEFYFYKDDKNFIKKEGQKDISYKIILEAGNLLVIENLSKDLIYENIKTFKIMQKNEKNNSFILEAIEIGKGYPWHSFNDSQYRGKFEFSVYNNTIKIVNIINIEEYLYSVLSSEMMSWWPIESLKAQAVLARSYAIYRKDVIKIHKNLGYDLCSSQHCQVYSGIATEIKRMNQAVDETRGKILKYNNSIVNGLYHSNSGGYTQPSKNVLGWADLPYFEGAYEGYGNDEEAPNSPSALEAWIKSYPQSYSYDKGLKTPISTFRWIRIVSPEYIQEKIEKDTKRNIGEIKDIIVTNRSPSGNINKIKIIGKNSKILVEKENKIRYYFGLNSLRSTMFFVEKKYSVDKEKILEFTFYGGGWGHGVGMSQTGAAGMANKGFKYDEILNFYFQNTYLESLEY